MSRPKYTLFRPRIRSRHPSHSILRPIHKKLPLFSKRSVIRFGSSHEYSDDRVEVNTVAAIKKSSNKYLMKMAFANWEVTTANWWTYEQGEFVYQSGAEDDQIAEIEELPYPIVAKKHYGSRNNGNTKIDSVEQFKEWIEGRDLHNYIFEKYYSYNREYRLHVTEDGCFYACRKMLKSDAPQEVRWYRNDAHCVWILEDNESFDKPANWDSIVDECVKALKAVGLDFGAIDLRVQSAKNSDGELREEPKFIVVEINSAPSFGEKTIEKYIEVLPQIINKKIQN